MAEYASMLLVSVLAAILFLGGWNGPVAARLTGAAGSAPIVGLCVAGYLGNLLGLLKSDDQGRAAAWP